MAGGVIVPSDGPAGSLTLWVFMTCLVAASGGLIFGYDIGISGGVSEMEPFMRRFFPRALERMASAKGNEYCIYDSQTLTAFTSSLYVAGLVGSLVASRVTKATGRRAIMLMGGALFLAGGAVTGAAVNIAMLIVGRILLGFGVGFTSQGLKLSKVLKAQSDVELSQLRKEVSELRNDTAKNTETLNTLSKDFLECKNMDKGLMEQKDGIQSVLEAKYKRISAEAIKKQEENNSEIFRLLQQLVEGNKKNHDIFYELAEEKKKTTQLLISMAAMQSTVDSLYDICSCCKQHMYDTLSLVRARPKQMIFKDADTSKALRWMDGEVKGFLECQNMVKGLMEQKDGIQSVPEARYKRISELEAKAIKKQEENVTPEIPFWDFYKF